MIAEVLMSLLLLSIIYCKMMQAKLKICSMHTNINLPYVKSICSTYGNIFECDRYKIHLIVSDFCFFPLTMHVNESATCNKGLPPHFASNINQT